ncbi:hypothetical protein FQR65_LT11461 [Abscondita terminalis]|nr:hypothetical protein FQR65_LT11461 [Abscondita terminalis]
MKLIVLVMLLANSAYLLEFPPEFLEEWFFTSEPYITECTCATDADSSLVARWFKYTEFPNDACLKCFIKCITQKLEFLNYDGTLNYDTIVKTVSFLNKSLIVQCEDKTPNTTDLCQLMFDLARCTLDKNSRCVQLRTITLYRNVTIDTPQLNNYSKTFQSSEL